MSHVHRDDLSLVQFLIGQSFIVRMGASLPLELELKSLQYTHYF